MKLITDGRLTPDQIHSLAMNPIPIPETVKPSWGIGSGKTNYNPEARKILLDTSDFKLSDR